MPKLLLALKSGGGVASPFAYSFQVKNRSASTSPGFKRGTLQYPIGEMPTGSIPVVTRSGSGAEFAVQFDAHADGPMAGSLGMSVFTVRDDSFTNAESRTYNCTAAVGSFNNTGSKTLADITGTTNFNMLFTGMTHSEEFGQTTNVPASPPYTITVAEAATWSAEVEEYGYPVYDYTAGNLTKVVGAPAANQYSVLAGVYTFHSSAAGHSILLNYYTAVTHGSGTFNWSFNTASANPLYVEKYASGAILEGWRVGGYATDNTGGAADAHLWCEGYVGLYKNAAGTVVNKEFWIEPILSEVAVANKYCLNYTAQVRDGTTVYATYSDLRHYYYAGWATLTTSNDNEEAEHFWTGSPPTLMHIPDFAYWINEAKVLPPYDLTVTPTSNASLGYTSRFAPLSGQDHRTALDATGGFWERSFVDNAAIVCMMTPTAANYRHFRVNAQVSRSYPRRLRSSDTRQRPATLMSAADGGPGKAKFVTVAQSLQSPTNAPSAYDFTSVGMPAANLINIFNSVNCTLAKGGKGPWNPGGYEDTSHFYIYSPAYFLYLLDGDPGMHQALMDQAMKGQNSSYPGEVNLAYYFYPNFRTAQSIPGGSAPYWHGVTQWTQYSNVRAVGHWLAALAAARRCCRNDDAQANYFRKVISHQGDYWALSKSYMPTAQITAGVYLNSTYGRIHNTLMSIGAEPLAQFSGDLNIADFADFNVIPAIANGNSSRLSKLNILYPHANLPVPYTNANEEQLGWHPTTNNFLPPEEIGFLIYPVPLNATTDVWTYTLPSDVGNGGTVANNDVMRPLRAAPGWNAVISPEFTAGEKLYVVDSGISGAGTFRLSRTEGGAHITFASNHTGQAFSYDPIVKDTSTVASTYIPAADSAARMMWAMIATHVWRKGEANCTAQELSARDAIRAYLHPSVATCSGNAGDYMWRMDI